MVEEKKQFLPKSFIHAYSILNIVLLILLDTNLSAYHN